MSAANLDFKDTMNVAETARRCSVARDTVYAWIHRGVASPSGRVRLQAVRVGGRIRITTAALEAFLEELNPERQAQLGELDAEALAESHAAARRLGWEK